MKYYNKQEEVRTLSTNKQPFKRVEMYFTYTMLYEDAFEATNDMTKESEDNRNEANSEPELVEDEDDEYEINPFTENFSKFNVINTADETSEWVINENIKFSFAPAVASDSMSSCTGTEVDSLSELEILVKFNLPIRPSLVS